MGQVSFWSPISGQCSNTANAAVVASIIGLEYDIRTLLSQTKFSNSTLEQLFLKSKEKKIGALYDYSDTGIDAMERLIRANRLTPESIKNNSIPLEKDRLDLLLGTSKPDFELYENLHHVVNALFQAASEYYQTIILDLQSGSNNILTKELLRTSEVIIVSLTQNIDVLEQFFVHKDLPNEMRNKKVMAVISQYDQNSKYKLSNIKRHFKVDIPIYTIPYCTDFKDAFNDKDVLGWVRRNRNINKKHANYYFLSEVRRLAKGILDELGVNTQLKLIERGA
ncbi:hypothetical protein M5X06_22115 [Paenibacillus alvei]|uniref:AAA domain-containing protein n=1 Tax=Paenibacillus alvei TaxID=44250 RepID=A0ABT4H2L7_PAEAL|nr:hypothetical protein [Paenibacillus alvei]MCY9763226.1 hypothetical protein [Paenibacillus alvei]MCY9769485.1 hypothetical protein [Paenibacillus alvei]